MMKNEKERERERERERENKPNPIAKRKTWNNINDHLVLG